MSFTDLSPENTIEGGTTGSIIGNIGDRLKTDSSLTLEGGALSDAFGRLRTSTPVVIFDAYFAETDRALAFTQKTVGTGSIVRNANKAAMELSVGSGNGARAVRQTKQYIHYIPGQSYNVVQTATLSTPSSNLIQRIGYFDDENGLFFETNGTEIFVVVRDNSSGSVLETKVERASWNGDPLDGTGASGVTLDLTKDNIYLIDFQWLGAGKVRFGFSFNGEPVVAHSFDNAGILTQSYMRQGSLPVRQEILNSGITSGTNTITSFCMSVISEGELNLFPQQTAVDTDGTISVNTSSYSPVIAIRLKSANIRGQLIPDSIKALATTNDDILIRTYYNPTITGGSWVSAGSDSIAEYNINMTSFSGGVHAEGELIAKAGGGPSSIGGISLTVNSDIDGNPDTFLVAAKSLTSAANLASVIVFKELF